MPGSALGKSTLAVDAVEDEEDETDTDDGLMYFDRIVLYDEESEYNNVHAYCSECEEGNPLSLMQFIYAEKDHARFQDFSRGNNGLLCLTL